MEEEPPVVEAAGGSGCDETAGWDRTDRHGEGRRSVRIRFDRLPALAEEIRTQRRRQATADGATHKDERSDRDGREGEPTEAEAGESTSGDNDGQESWIEWDTEGWHYSGEGFVGSEKERRERVALYLLALDAINFCFWPLPEGSGGEEDLSARSSSHSSRNNLLEYEHLAMALKKMAEADHTTPKDPREPRPEYAFSARSLSAATPESMLASLRPCLDPKKYPLPNPGQRAALWREVGEGLEKDYGGSALALLDRAGKNAPKLVERIAASFPGFRDEVYLPKGGEPSKRSPPQRHHQRLVFLKRAQILAGDLNAALKLNLGGIERLTTFADYRVPQILRHRGVLEYAPGLASRVDGLVELGKGSCDEVSIRAATVVAVEELVGLLNQPSKRGDGGQPPAAAGGYSDVTVDWYLWQAGEKMHREGAMKPFHKVRTHYY